MPHQRRKKKEEDDKRNDARESTRRRLIENLGREVAARVEEMMTRMLEVWRVKMEEREERRKGNLGGLDLSPFER